MKVYPEPFSRSTASQSLLSIVIPMFNERAVLPQFLERITGVVAALDMQYELVFVDDGSTDGSADFLSQVRPIRRNLRVIRLSRNFGKEAALTAGLDHARGDAAIVMDADLQDPPEQIPRMVGCWRRGSDVVLMRRRRRAGDSLVKRGTAFAFYRLLKRAGGLDIPVDTGDFRLLSRKSLDAVRQLPERNRYMKGLFAWIGMPTQVLEYDREARQAGTTKWKFAGLFTLAVEGITSFSIRPLRLATGTGLVAAMLGALFGLWIVAKALLLGDPTEGYPSLIAIITFLGGIQLLAVGILGEYVGKTYLESKARPIYLVRDIVECSAPSTHYSIEAVRRGERHA